MYKKVAAEYDLKVKDVAIAYKLFWKFIRDTIAALPLKDKMTEEEFNKLKTNFNLPSMGKLYIDPVKFKYINYYYNAKNKKDKTSV